jgi:single-strand DNA-binding protein
MASRSLNKATLVGNLTRDPELKYTPSGAPVCTFGVATNRSWVTHEGQTKEEVQYHRIVAWHKLAELCAKLLVKGRKVFLEGRLSYRSYTGKDGVQRNITEIILEDFIVFSDGKRVAVEEPAPAGVTAEKVEKKETEDLPIPEENNKNEEVNPDDIPF